MIRSRHYLRRDLGDVTTWNTIDTRSTPDRRLRAGTDRRNIGDGQEGGEPLPKPFRYVTLVQSFRCRSATTRPPPIRGPGHPYGTLQRELPGRPPQASRRTPGGFQHLPQEPRSERAILQQLSAHRFGRLDPWSGGAVRGACRHQARLAMHVIDETELEKSRCEQVVAPAPRLVRSPISTP
jgi:hypothetical protein